MDYKIIKNFLDKETFTFIQQKTMGRGLNRCDMAYFFNSTVAYDDEKTNQCYFTHSLYEYDQPQSGFFESILVPLAKRLDLKSLIRAKVNLYPKTEKVVEHDSHTDLSFPHLGCVYSINTNDGYTRLGDIKIPSIENQALIFDSSKPHNSTTCTNALARFNININYF